MTDHFSSPSMNGDDDEEGMKDVEQQIHHDNSYALGSPDINYDSFPASMDEKQRDSNVRYRDPPKVHVAVDNITYAPIVRSNNHGKQGFSSFFANRRNKTSQSSSLLNHRVSVLHNITCDIEPSSLTAWMGPSGSGKTSLISVVAGLCPTNDVRSGQIFINGSKSKMIKSHVGVVWQDDLLLSNLTVEETIMFAAKLKVPQDIENRKEEIRARVEDAIRDLALENVKLSLIGGGSVRGISGGERKRVAVAVELVSKPSVLLLDEPTSGLDSTSALNLMKILKSLAQNHGHSVACVIHQPRPSIFQLFDSLLLLSKGRTVYCGRPIKARQFLETVVPYDPGSFGISDIDWIMDSILFDEMNGSRLSKAWRKIESDSEHISLVSNRRRQILANLPSIESLKESSGYNTGFFYQLQLLTARSMKQQRGEKLTQVALIVTIAYTLFTSLFWFQIPDDTDRIYERNSLLFFILIAQSNSIVTASIATFQRERALLARERSKKLYSVLPYFIGKTLSDMINTILLPSIYGVAVYWSVNLRPTIGSFLVFMLFFYLTLLTSQSMGLLLSVAIRRIEVSLLLAPLISIFLFIMGGFYVPFDNINIWMRWSTYISQARYGYTGMILNEYQGRLIPCSENVGVDYGSGECPLPGEEVLKSLDMDGQKIWFQVLILLLMQVVLRYISYIVLRLRRE